MVEVIELRKRGLKSFSADTHICFEKETFDESCASPIVFKRQGEGCLNIYLHSYYYMIPFVENALKGLCYGEENVWRLCKLDEDPSSPYLGYGVVLQRYFGYETDDVLTTIVSRIIKEIYLEEIRAWGDDVCIDELTKPYRHKLEEGVNINKKTKKLLTREGFRNAWDLANTTREDICRIHGMTTEDVVRLEKSLASRGIFLKTQLPSIV